MEFRAGCSFLYETIFYIGGAVKIGTPIEFLGMGIWRMRAKVVARSGWITCVCWFNKGFMCCFEYTNKKV